MNNLRCTTHVLAFSLVYCNEVLFCGVKRRITAIYFTLLQWPTYFSVPENMLSQLVISSLPMEEVALELEHQKLAESKTASCGVDFRVFPWDKRLSLYFTSQNLLLFLSKGDSLSACPILRTGFVIDLLIFQKFSALTFYLLWTISDSSLGFLFSGFQAAVSDCFVRPGFIPPRKLHRTGPILICASSFSAKHLKLFSTGWTTLHLLEVPS